MKYARGVSVLFHMMRMKNLSQFSRHTVKSHGSRQPHTGPTRYREVVLTVSNNVLGGGQYQLAIAGAYQFRGHCWIQSVPPRGSGWVTPRGVRKSDRLKRRGARGGSSPVVRTLPTQRPHKSAL